MVFTSNHEHSRALVFPEFLLVNDKANVVVLFYVINIKIQTSNMHQQCSATPLVCTYNLQHLHFNVTFDIR